VAKFFIKVITLATPKEIKSKFFYNVNNVDSTYIKEILIKFFKFEKAEKNISYKSLDNIEFKTGQPFFIKKSVIFDENGEKKCKKNDEKHDFFNENSPNFDILEAISYHKKELQKLEQIALRLDVQTVEEIPLVF